MRYLSIALIFWFSITTPVRVTGFMGWTLRAVVLAWGIWLTVRMLRTDKTEAIGDRTKSSRNSKTHET